MLNSIVAALAMCVLTVSGVAHANTLGNLRVEGALTLDASTPLFEFTTFEVQSGGSVTFIGLEASDTLVLRASEAIRIDGAIVLAPANALQLEAPTIVIGMGAMFDLSGSSFTVDTGGTRSGATISLPGLDQSRTQLPGNIVGTGEPLTEPQGNVSLQAPVPEADTWLMLAVGLVVMMGVGARRRGTARV